MTGRQQWAVVAAIVALLGAGAFAATHFLGDELTSVTVGADAPAFSAVTISGEEAAPQLERTLADYRGEVVLLNIWATWCGPCREEMPSIEALHEALGPKGLRVVAVSIDPPGKDAEIRKFMAEYGLKFDVLYDTAGAVQKIYRTTGVPETFVIARDGTIRKKIIGPEDWNSPANRRLMESLLAEPRS